ncbi:MAG: hypothetical protein ACRC7B_00380 [Metamycoplasmataceae bacterium]
MIIPIQPNKNNDKRPHKTLESFAALLSKFVANIAIDPIKASIPDIPAQITKIKAEMGGLTVSLIIALNDEKNAIADIIDAIRERIPIASIPLICIISPFFINSF